MQKKAQTFNTLTNSFRPWLLIKIDGKFECVIVPDRGFPSFFFRVPRALHQSNTPPFLRFFSYLLFTFFLFRFLPFELLLFLAFSLSFSLRPSPSETAVATHSGQASRICRREPSPRRARALWIREGVAARAFCTHHLIVLGQKTVERYESKAFCAVENPLRQKRIRVRPWHAAPWILPASTPC